MPDDTRYRDAEWLREQYCEKALSSYEIAEKVGCADVTVRRWMDKHEIERRSFSEAKLKDDQLYRDADWLREQYWEQKRSFEQMADLAGCCIDRIREWMRRHDIDRRSHADAFRVSNKVDTGDGRHQDADWLQKQIDDGLSTTEIAEKCGVRSVTISKWLRRHGIEPNGPKTGEESPNWTGGTADYYGENWLEQRRRTLERDGYACQDCGLTNDDHKRQYGRELHVHHVQKLRTFDEPAEANRLDNLVTLCESCHYMKWEPMSPLRPQTAD